MAYAKFENSIHISNGNVEKADGSTSLEFCRKIQVVNRNLGAIQIYGRGEIVLPSNSWIEVGSRTLGDTEAEVAHIHTPFGDFNYKEKEIQ